MEHELGAAHGAEVRHFGTVGRQGFVVEVACGVGVQAQSKLVHPAELEARFGQRVIACAHDGVAHGHVFTVGQAQVGQPKLIELRPL